jgi:hypothetical protein
MDEAERLDLALEAGVSVGDPDVDDLVLLAGGVRSALAAPRLAAEVRARLWERALHRRRSVSSRAGRLVRGRTAALAGGAAVTVAAAAVGITLVRGRRRRMAAVSLRSAHA